MAYERLNLIRQVGAKYWQIFISLAAIFAPAFKVIKDATSGTTLQTWIFVGIGLFVIIAIRFPKVAVAITRLILGPPKSPSSLPTIFKGPRPYSSDDMDKFPGRQKEVADCWGLIESNSFFIIDGESGCGKSSLLNAALLPKAREKFRVIECRVADDPFGKLRAAMLKEPYRQADQDASKEELSAAIALAVEGYVDRSTSDGSRTDKPLLLCIDQFEEAFATVRDEVRNQFVEALKDAIREGKLRVILALRSDFFDLLMKVCDAVDPDREIVNLGNYYTLRAFRKDQAEYVLDEVLDPICASDPALRPQIEDFAKALIQELLRPPRDKRLSRDDEKTVLPVELQTVGMMIESSGLKNFSVGGLKELGGKIGLLKAYIEEAKIYVWRKTAVSSDKALLILRQLISPAQTKWAQTSQSIAVGLDIPSTQIEKVLDAFADRYLVNPLPITTDGISPEAAGAAQQYELMHEHLVQILIEAPDPILQKARDAEERLRFWGERTKSAQWAATGGKLQSARTRIASLFFQPIPLGETFSLWKFARSGDERKMLKRSLRGFILRLAVAVLVISITMTSWFAWTQTEWYQIQKILSDAPVAEASFNDHQAVNMWIRTLAYIGHADDAIFAAQNIKDSSSRFGVLTSVSLSLLEVGNIKDALKLLDDAFTGLSDMPKERYEAIARIAEIMTGKGIDSDMLASIRKVDNISVRTQALISAAKGMRKANNSAVANYVLGEALAYTQAISREDERALAFINVINELINAGRYEEAKKPIDELLSITGQSKSATIIGSIIEILTKVSRTNEARNLLNSMSSKSSKNWSDNRETADIARIASRAGLDKEALLLAGKTKKPEIIAEVISGLADGGRTDEAISLLRKMDESNGWYEGRFGYRSNALSSIAVKLASDGNVKKGSSMIDEIAKSKDKGSSQYSYTILERLEGYEDKDLSENRAELFEGVIKDLIEAEKLKEALFIFCDRDNDRKKRPSALSNALVKSGKTRAALAAVRDIVNGPESPIALAAVAEALAETDKLDEAKRILDESLSYVNAPLDYFWSRAFLRVSVSFIKADKADDILDSAHKIKHKDAKLEALIIIADKLVFDGKLDKGKDVLLQALPIIPVLMNPSVRSRLIPKATVMMAKVGLIDEAKKHTEDALALAPDESRDEVRSAINIATILGLAKNGQIEEAETTFQQITKGISGYRKTLYRASFAISLARGGNIDAALAIAQEIELEPISYHMTTVSVDRDYTLTKIAVEMAEAGKVDEALKAARVINSLQEQSEANVAVVKGLVKAKKISEALAVAGEIKNAGDRSEAFNIVAKEFARLRNFRMARLTANNCSSAVKRLNIYSTILLEDVKGRDSLLRAKLEAQETDGEDEEFAIDVFRNTGTTIKSLIDFSLP